MPSLLAAATAVLALGQIASANLLERSYIAARQQQNPATDTDGDSPNVAALIPPECQQQCSAFANLAQGCATAENQAECACKKEVVDATVSCVPCFPSIAYDVAFQSNQVTLKQWIQGQLDSCQQAGYPVQGFDPNSVPDTPLSVSVETIPPESRTDITYSSTASSGASNAAGSASSAASSNAARPTSAAASISSAANAAVSSGASSAAAESSPAPGSAARFAKASGSIVALAAVAAVAMAI